MSNHTDLAVDALESMAQTAEIVAWHICIRGCDGSADWCELGADRPECPPEADALALVYAHSMAGQIQRLNETLKRQDKAHHAEVQEQVAAERERTRQAINDRLASTVMSSYASKAECEAARAALRNAMLDVWGA